MIDSLILRGVELKIGRSSDDWMQIREVKGHCEIANVIYVFSLYAVISNNDKETSWM